MLKQYEVETIIINALEELNGKLSKPNYDDGECTVYESNVEDKGKGVLELSFKEDMLDKEETPAKYRITVELI